uniref:ARF GTPase-activating protein GIT2 (Trinotate prediction) n=1 Tax=Henneguya salminicola TaxID=69463 RepID=A0A6G3MHS1_HENSL
MSSLNFDQLKCIDCDCPKTNWVSLNNFVILCDDCAQVHFSFGSGISQVYHFNQLLYLPHVYTELLSHMIENKAYDAWVENSENVLLLNPSLNLINKNSSS